VQEYNGPKTQLMDELYEGFLLRYGNSEDLEDETVLSLYLARTCNALQSCGWRKNHPLKPCCGKWPSIGSLGGDKQNWAIWCEECGRCVETGVNGETKDEIIEEWNRGAEDA